MNDIILHQPDALSTDLRTVGQQANAAASRRVFDDYRMRKAANSRQDSLIAKPVG